MAASSTCSSTISLVYNNAIGSCGSDESGAVRVSSPAGIEVEGDVGEAITKGTKQEHDVSNEPAIPVSVSENVLIFQGGEVPTAMSGQGASCAGQEA